MQKAVRFFLAWACFLEGRVDVLSQPEGGDTMAVYEAITLMLAFGSFIIMLLGLIIVIVKHLKK